MHRERTGEGQEVKGTLLGTALAVFGSHLAEQGATGIDRVGTGNRVQTSAPSAVFATRDGHVLTHVVGNGLFKRWARLMGDESLWTGDARFKTDQSRGDHGEDILARMAAWCAARTSGEAVAELDAAGFRRAGLHAAASARRQPSRGDALLHAVRGYPGLARPVPVSGLPVRLGKTPVCAPNRPPTLGEHTDAILEELGYSPAEIGDLKAQQVV